MANKTASRLLEREITAFLGSPDPEALCIRGKWGVGKTFAWREYLREARRKNITSSKRYSYVSLFGIETLEQLKYALFENTLRIDKIDVEPSLETLKDNTSAVSERLGRSWLNTGLQFVPFLRSATSATQAISFLWVDSLIICIDDLERKSDRLKVLDILGLISFLKERRKCKVALIVNDAELSEADLATLEKNQEKIFDHILLFDPTPQEAADIILTGTDSLSGFLREKCCLLEITNIRIISRLYKFSVELKSILKDHSDTILERTLSSLILFGYLHFTRQTEFHTFATQHTRFPIEPAFRSRLSADELQWNECLGKLGYLRDEELDELIIHSMKKGFFDREAVVSLADKLRTKLHAEATDFLIWHLDNKWFDDFTTSAESVAQDYFQLLERNLTTIRPSSFQDILSRLRTLGQPLLVERATTLFLQRAKTDLLVNDKIDDSNLRTGETFDKLWEIELEHFKNREPVQLLLRLVKENRISNSHSLALSKITADDLYQLFLTLQGQQLKDTVLFSLSDIFPYTRDAAMAALDRLSDENAFNKLRVEHFYWEAKQDLKSEQRLRIEALSKRFSEFRKAAAAEGLDVGHFISPAELRTFADRNTDPVADRDFDS